MIYAKTKKNIVQEIISCRVAPTGGKFVAFPDTAQITLGDNVTYYNSDGIRYTVDEIIANNIIPPPLSNEVIIWAKGEYKKVEKLEGRVFWDTSTKAQRGFKNGETLPTNVTEVKPQEFDKWNDATRSWVPDLAAYKAYAAKKVHVALNEELEKGVLYETQHIEMHVYGQTALSGALAIDSIGGVTYPYSWKTYENTFVTFNDSPSFQTFAKYVFSQVNIKTQEMFRKKERIYNATTADEITTILGAV